MNPKKTGLVTALVVMCLVLATGSCLATTYTWIGGPAGEWGDKANWNPNTAVPGGADIAIINTGYCNITNSGFNIAGITVGPGSQLAINHGGGLGVLFEYGPNPFTFSNDGTVTISGNTDSGGGASLSCGPATMTFTGSGTVILGGLVDIDTFPYPGWGGHYINDTAHTIRGGGTIAALVENRGQIIADNGDLYFSGGVSGAPGSVMKASGANRLRLYGNNPTFYSGGQILPQDGLVYLQNTTVRNISFGPGNIEVHSGGTFQEGITFAPGAHVIAFDGVRIVPSSAYAISLTNNGTITGSIDTGSNVTFNNTVTLTGTGIVNMTGLGGGGWGGKLINDVGHTIQGSGTFDGGTPFTNNGTLRVADGTLTIWTVSGAGTISVNDNGNLVLGNGSNVQAGNFSMSTTASLQVGNWQGGTLTLSKDFTFSQTDPAKWTWDANTTLQMSGGGAQQQSLEVGGHDYGLSSTGFNSNFNLPRLFLAGAGTYVNLVDNVDNGHRAGGREALYVTTLQVDPGATLNLNGLRLYAKREGTIYRVLAGQGALYGGGKIIDKAGVGALLLLLLGD